MGGDDDEAKKLAEDLSVKDPPRGYNMLAYYYALVDEDLPKADEAIKKSMSFDSDKETSRIVLNSNANLLNQLGYSFLNREDFVNSHKYFKWAISLRPDYENPYDSMGDYYATTAQFDSAIIYYEKALAIRPEFTVSIYNKGLMLEKLGKKDQAIVIYKGLIQKYPENRYADQAADRLEALQD
jgi:tetratricopeptide (TPR) repeat protein